MHNLSFLQSKKIILKAQRPSSSSGFIFLLWSVGKEGGTTGRQAGFFVLPTSVEETPGPLAHLPGLREAWGSREDLRTSPVLIWAHRCGHSRCSHRTLLSHSPSHLCRAQHRDLQGRQLLNKRPVVLYPSSSVHNRMYKGLLVSNIHSHLPYFT